MRSSPISSVTTRRRWSVTRRAWTRCWRSLPPARTCAVAMWKPYRSRNISSWRASTIPGWRYRPPRWRIWWRSRQAKRRTPPRWRTPILNSAIVRCASRWSRWQTCCARAAWSRATAWRWPSRARCFWPWRCTALLKQGPRGCRWIPATRTTVCGWCWRTRSRRCSLLPTSSSRALAICLFPPLVTTCYYRPPMLNLCGWRRRSRPRTSSSPPVRRDARKGSWSGIPPSLTAWNGCRIITRWMRRMWWRRKRRAALTCRCGSSGGRLSPGRSW